MPSLTFVAPITLKRRRIPLAILIVPNVSSRVSFFAEILCHTRNCICICFFLGCPGFQNNFFVFLLPSSYFRFFLLICFRSPRWAIHLFTFLFITSFSRWHCFYFPLADRLPLILGLFLFLITFDISLTFISISQLVTFDFCLFFQCLKVKAVTLGFFFLEFIDFF